jgi:hypothetical protein
VLSIYAAICRIDNTTSADYFAVFQFSKQFAYPPALGVLSIYAAIRRIDNTTSADYFAVF